MPACGRCGHDNAAQLSFCFRCGRRLGGTSERTPPSDQGFAETVALQSLENGPRNRTPLLLAWESIQYAVTYLPRRIQGPRRRRLLLQRRAETSQLIESTLSEIGNAIVSSSISAPALAELGEARARATALRDAAAAELSSTERRQVATDLRLGVEQDSAEAELKACDAGAATLDAALARIEEDRRHVEATREGSIGESVAAPSGSDSDAERKSDSATGAHRLAHLDDQYRALREQAAALRATTIAARAKRDQVISARRLARNESAVSLAHHTRARAEAEGEIQRLTVEIGRTAVRARLPQLSTLPGHERMLRIQAGMTDLARQLEALPPLPHRCDVGKLTMGLALMVTIAGAAGAGLWALLR